MMGKKWRKGHVHLWDGPAMSTAGMPLIPSVHYLCVHQHNFPLTLNNLKMTYDV